MVFVLSRLTDFTEHKSSLVGAILLQMVECHAAQYHEYPLCVTSNISVKIYKFINLKI